jgi:DNA replication protein DnaC
MKKHCENFIGSFTLPETKNIFFCGPSGVGKTFMANCIAAELMKNGRSVLYQSAPMLFSSINDNKFRRPGNDGDDDAEASYSAIYEADLLIIDDLGTEPPSAARYADMLTILNVRHMNNLSKPCKTIISTNIDVKRLADYYDERIVSRITGCFDLFHFAGDDIRIRKKLSGKWHQ